MNSLIYNGRVINERDDLLSLTDMWRAANGTDSRRPYEWARTDIAEMFISHISSVTGQARDELIQTLRGNEAGTWAHWQIGMAYAQYLSPEFHAWCNQVVKEHMEGKHAYLAEQQAKWDLSRWYTRNGYKKMMAALEQQNPLISPDQIKRLKWSEANLLNYTLVGINNHDFGYWFKTDSVRDCLAGPQIDAMDYLQAMNTSLILSDVDYSARSEILSKTLERQFPTCKAYKDYLVRLIAYRLETVQYHLKPIAPKEHEIFNPFVRIGTTPNNLLGRRDS